MQDKFELAKEYLGALLPKVKVELLENGVDGYPTIVIDDWVNIWPEVVEEMVATIVGDKKQNVTYFNVDLAVEIPGSRWEPPSVDIVEIGKSKYFDKALEMAIFEWVKNDINLFMENKMWEQRAKEQEEEY